MNQLLEVLTQEKPFVGYECEFVDPPPAAFQTECLICQLVLRERFKPLFGNTWKSFVLQFGQGLSLSLTC